MPFVGTVREYGPSLWLQLREGDGGSAIIVLEPDLSVSSYRFSDYHWVHHRRLENLGYLTHSAAVCPLRKRPVTLREWTSDRDWRDVVIQPIVPERP